MQELPVLELKDKANKWLVRSALQKAIRRGKYEEALFSGGYLFGEGVGYFWKSLATIAVEDVGIGNPTAVADTFTIFNEGMASPHYKDRAYIGDLIGRMCITPKSRLMCEISIVADWGPKELFDQYLQAPLLLVRRALNFKDPVKSYVALKIIFGAVKGAPKLNALRNEVLSWIYKNPELDEAKKSAITQMLQNPFDSMCIAGLPAFMMERADQVEPTPETLYTVTADTFPSEVEIKGLSSAAYDMHTAVGKKSIKAFYTSLAKRFPVITQIPPENAVKALGAVLFVLEGGQVDQRITSSRMLLMKTRQDVQLMRTYGVPKELIEPVLEIVGAEFERLNGKRVWASQL
jgi:hypothetical protein